MIIVLLTWRSRFKAALQALLWARIDLAEREAVEAPPTVPAREHLRRRRNVANPSLETSLEQDEARLWWIEQEEERAIAKAMEEEF